jgi:glucosamine 6-phosphate synthetase-like amidotransferase/phosphosugar isomerase protein
MMGGSGHPDRPNRPATRAAARRVAQVAHAAPATLNPRAGPRRIAALAALVGLMFSAIRERLGVCMCGIVGYFGSGTVGLTRVLGGMSSILYRAPDSTGAAWLGDEREPIRVRKAIGPVPEFMETLLDEGIHPDRASALRRLWWLPPAKGDMAHDPGPGDLERAQVALLRWEQLPVPRRRGSRRPSFEELLAGAPGREPLVPAGTRGRAGPLPSFRLSGEADLLAVVEHLAVELDLPPVISRTLARRALEHSYRASGSIRHRGSRGAAGLDELRHTFDLLFERVVGSRLFYPTPPPGGGGASGLPADPPTSLSREPTRARQVWALLGATELRVPVDFDRDGVRAIFRLLDGQLLARTTVHRGLDEAVQDFLLYSWAELRGRQPGDWLSLYAAEKAVNVFGRAAAAAWAVLRREAAGLSEAEALRYFSSPVVAHGRWALQSPVTVANAHPFLDAEGKRAIALNGQFNPEVEREVRAFLIAAGARFRSENSAEYLALLWGYYFDLLLAEQRRAETIRSHVDGGLEAYTLGSQAIDYRVLSSIQGKSEAQLDEMAFIEATRRLVRRGGQAAVAGQSLYSPRRLYVASHDRPVFLVRRQEGDEVMVVSDVNAASGLFSQREFQGSYRKLRELHEQGADEIARLKAGGAVGFELQEARERRLAREQELLQRLRLRVLPLEGGENFACVESASELGVVRRRVEVMDFDGNRRTELEEIDTVLNPLQAEKEMFTSFYEGHLKEIPDRLRDVLSLTFAGGGPVPQLSINHRLLSKRFGARLETLRRILLVGMGSSYRVAQIAARVLTDLLPGREAIAVLPVERERLFQSVDPEKDLVVCLSWSGTTAESAQFAAELLSHKAAFLAVTNKPYSDLGLLAWKSMGVINLMSGEELTVAAVKSPISELFGVCLLGMWLAVQLDRTGEAARLAQSLQALPELLERTFEDAMLRGDTRAVALASSACSCALVVDDLRGYGTGRQGVHALADAGDGMVVKILDYEELRAWPLRGRSQELLVLVNAGGRRSDAREAMKRLFLAGVPFAAVGGAPDFSEAAELYSRGRRLRLPAATGILRPFVELMGYSLLALELAQAQGATTPGFPRNRVKSVTAGRVRAAAEPVSGRSAPTVLSVSPAAPPVALAAAVEQPQVGGEPTTWEEAAVYEWERSRYRGIRCLAHRLGASPAARSLFARMPEAGAPVYPLLFDHLREGGEVLFLALDRGAEAAAASAADLWSRLSTARVRAERWKGAAVRPAEDRVVFLVASRAPGEEALRSLETAAEPVPAGAASEAAAPEASPSDAVVLPPCWILPAEPPPEAHLLPAAPGLFLLCPETVEAGPAGLYLAMAWLLVEVWRERAPQRAEAVEQALAGTAPAVEATLAAAALRSSIEAAATAGGRAGAYFVGPSRGRCLAWQVQFERPGALFLGAHLYGEGAHGPLASVDPRPESKYVPLRPRKEMVAEHGEERVRRWEQKFLGPGRSFDELAGGLPGIASSGHGELFFARGGWWLPVLRPGTDRDALIILDATSHRGQREALDELAVYGCRFARLAILSQAGFGPGRDPAQGSPFPVPAPLLLPPVGGTEPIQDSLLPVVTGLVATAFAAASCRARGEADEAARGGEEEEEEPLLLRRCLGRLGEALSRTRVPLAALAHTQVAALRSLAPLVTGVRKSASFAVLRVRGAAELEELRRTAKVRRLPHRGRTAAGSTAPGAPPAAGGAGRLDRAAPPGGNGVPEGVLPGGQLFLLKPEPPSRSSVWSEAYGTSWEALEGGDLSIGERVDGTPVLELPLMDESGNHGRLYRYTVRYLEWDHGAPLEPQLEATIEAMQKGLPALNRHSAGYLALVGSYSEALRSLTGAHAESAETPWQDWLLALLPRSWLLRKPSLELARLLADRTAELLSRPAGPAREVADVLSAAAGAAMARVWGALAGVDGGEDAQRWPLLREKLGALLADRRGDARSQQRGDTR